MKTLLTVTAFVISAALSAPALAAAHKTAPDMAKAASAPQKTAQQTKMASCNADAADKKGDDRKAFMKSCLSSKKATQQDKMKQCNADATGKKGDERKAFMKECLSA